jgi:hypothetical protein
MLSHTHRYPPRPVRAVVPGSDGFLGQPLFGTCTAAGSASVGLAAAARLAVTRRYFYTAGLLPAFSGVRLRPLEEGLAATLANIAACG